MKIFDFKNNALFLACYHERNRPVLILCLIGLILAVLVLAYLTLALERAPVGNIMEGMFWVMVTMQTVVLTVVGSLFVWHMGAREKSSGTLDFHRSSPEAVSRKIIGLILGSTWLEWIIFWAFFAAEIVLVGFLKYRLGEVVLFNVSVALTAVFLHITAAFFSLLSSGKNSRHSFLTILFLLWFSGPLFFLMSQASALFVHLFGLTAYRFLIPEVFKEAANIFFVVRMPDLVLQMMVQVPLAVLFIISMKRIFCQPNSPVLSKPNVIRLCFFCLFLIAGFFMSSFLSLGEVLSDQNAIYDYRFHSYYYSKNVVNEFIAQGMGVYLWLFFALGLVAAIASAPTYFQYTKRIVLMSRDDDPRRQNVFSDGASSLLPVVIYAALGTILFWFYVQAMGIPWTRGMGIFIWITGYGIALSGFLEYFRLSRFRYNKVFFFSVLTIWWIFVPWAVALFRNFDFGKTMSFAVVSPFMGISRSYWLLSPENARFGLDIVEILSPWLAALIVWMLAVWQRAEVKEQIEDQLDGIQ